MVGESGYVPPPYVPLSQSDDVSNSWAPSDSVRVTNLSINGPQQWSSGICACFDNVQSCCIGVVCPCYLFSKNAEILDSGTLFESCMMHSVLWVSINTFCCLLTEGFLLGVLGCFVACYACRYRKALRLKYNLEEAPCGDFTTHFFCHLCATCQEYREIQERNRDSISQIVNTVEVAAPSLQTMESTSTK